MNCVRVIATLAHHECSLFEWHECLSAMTRGRSRLLGLAARVCKCAYLLCNFLPKAAAQMWNLPGKKSQVRTQSRRHSASKTSWCYYMHAAAADAKECTPQASLCSHRQAVADLGTRAFKLTIMQLNFTSPWCHGQVRYHA